MLYLIYGWWFGITVTVRATDRGLPTTRTSASDARVTINVIRNEFRPIFFNTSYEETVSELVTVGTTVITVRASDADTNPQFNQIRYDAIGDDSATSFFSLNAITGVITTTADLTQENVNFYNLRVVASDNGEPARSATVVVKINILRNFQAPVFVQNNYAANILETQAFGVSIVAVTATDGDRNAPHNTVYYRLIGNARALNFFQVNEVTGEVSVRTSLTTDLNRAGTYQLTIEARDRGTPELVSIIPATVLINVGRNQNPPVFINEPYGRTISQSVSAGDSIFRVTAVDADNQNNNVDPVTYSIVGLDTAPTFFNIDPNNGDITVARSLVTDTATTYQILVQALDSGVPALSDLSTVTITVNRNLNPPEFVQNVYNVTILETRPLGETFVTVRATDADLIAPNNVVNYRGVSTQLALEYFLVNSVTGDISVRSVSLYTDTNTLYTLTVQAQDLGVPAPLIASPSAIVNINVLRNQFAPVFINTPYQSTIQPGTTPGTNIFTVTATDSDLRTPYNLVSYSIISGQVGSNFFSISSQTGDIFLQNSIFNDAASFYRILVRAVDGGNPARDTYAVVTLTVNRNLAPPVWVDPGAPGYTVTRSVPETIGISDLIYALTASDADTSAPFNEIEYSIVGQGDASFYFNVDPSSGEVRLRSSLLQDTESFYTVLVQIADRGVPSNVAAQTATVQVNVFRNQNTPVFINTPYATTVQENTGVGQSIFRVTATDADLVGTFEQVSYEIIGDDEAPVYFQVNSQTGVISVRSSLATASDSVFIRIRAFDNGAPVPRSNTTVVVVSILRNLNRPLINPLLYTTVIPDTTPLGSAVVTVTATDADSGPPQNTIRFTSRGANVAAEQFFFVDSVTGVVSVKQALTLDNVQNSFYELFVSATDLGVLPLQAPEEARVQITVTRNQNTPVFVNTPYAVTIPETEAVTTSILSVSVFDADTVSPFNEVTLRAIGDGAATNYFSIDNAGDIRVTRDLRLDTADVFTLRVEAKDGGNPAETAVALVTINVLRNLFAPVFVETSYEVTIFETRDLGSSFLTVRATDADNRVGFK
ncbi:protocadherin Fat 4 [Elysia marginata]|uniref:Protocadherin Fat 4 n=1 Tax=Elysia marginata TaxID=1093978 RepID=A0AAV4GYI8_9GAST|nr:protocadherin Fat 4 [Elysia marginata]